MTEPFNPFASWLGLDPKTKNPHHFQLLGLSSRVTDPVEIQKTVDAAAKRHLERLAKVPAGEHDELVDKLKQRIAIARKTLLDPTLRSSYLEKLKQLVQANQQTSVSGLSLAQPTVKTSETVPPAGSAQPASPPSAPPTHPSPAIAAAVPTDPNSPMPPPFVPATTPPGPGIDGVAPEAKSPVPMAVPISATPATASAAPLVAPAKPAEHRGLAVNADGVPIDQVRIQKRPLRRKHSKLGLIMAIVMLPLLGAGGVLIYQNRDELAKRGGIGENIPAAPGIIEEDELTTYDPTTANVNNTLPDPKKKLSERGHNKNAQTSERNLQAEKKLPELDLNDLPELNVDEVMGPPQASVSTPRSPEKDKARLARIKEHLAKMRSEDESAIPDPNVNLIELDESQLVRLRRHIERAQRSIYRREKSAAAKLLQSAEGVVEEVGVNVNASFNPKQAPVVRMVADTKEVFELVGGFWDQVVASSQEIPGGQEIRIGNQIVSFVEADQEKVIVRNAGSNITYQYHFCPPGLAMALATQGAIPDIPTWSKQQAAFYAVDQLGGANHQSKIEACLRIAEEANHDCSGIRRYCEFEFGTVGIPSEKIEIGTRNELDEALADFRAKNEYTDPEELDPDVAGRLAEMLLGLDSPDVKQRVAFLEEARKLAIGGGEVSKAEDAVIELDHFAKIDRANLMCELFIELSIGELSQNQRRALIERAIPFLRSDSGALADRKSKVLLSRHLMKIANSDGMTDAVRRLNQIDEN